MGTIEQKRQAVALFEQMKANDCSRQGMELRCDEVEIQATKVGRDGDKVRRANLLMITGEIRTLINQDAKLYRAALFNKGDYNTPYSEL